MRYRVNALCLALSIIGNLLCGGVAVSDEGQPQYYEINSTLMEVTFLVYVPSAKEEVKTSFGTALFMG